MMSSAPTNSASNDTGSYNPLSEKTGGMKNWQWGALGLGAVPILGSMFKKPAPFVNPADKAMPFLEKIPEAMRPYFEKFINQGGRAGDVLEGQYGAMTKDPSQFFANLGKGYQESPGYQFKLDQAMKAAGNAAAAGGMLGSPMHQFESERMAEGLADQDYENYMKHMMDVFGLGQKGYEDLYNNGYGASTEYGNNLASILMSQAGLAGRGAAEQNKYNQSKFEAENKGFGDLSGLFMKMLPFLGKI